jgi:hypothetical protein
MANLNDQQVILYLSLFVPEVAGLKVYCISWRSYLAGISSSRIMYTAVSNHGLYVNFMIPLSNPNIYE